MNPDHIERRLLLKRVAALGLLVVVEQIVSAHALTSPADTGSHIALSGAVIDLMIGGQVVPS